MSEPRGGTNLNARSRDPSKRPPLKGRPFAWMRDPFAAPDGGRVLSQNATGRARRRYYAVVIDAVPAQVEAMSIA